ncbi:aldo/keto reductase [Nocardia sp. alder85J]|uniref:aldo/keto reductase n=1 Tax=Nocardia sp. alder85J TaxID=2862949 RepID=UPI001CD4A909|nr:aldo/keto reductase [Nocardia sp. alder85J]MCX4095645.1 aldo/keto reductase [Nocardia sp. alder85J]
MLISELVLGTATFGDTVDAATAADIIAAASDSGITAIDTADVYAQGRSEEILGSALGAKRDRFVLCTKVGSRVGDTESALRTAANPHLIDHSARWQNGIAPTDRGLSRKHIVAGIESSLRRLRTDYVDLYQVHLFDPITPIEETLAAVDDLVRSGKVRAVGCSGWAAWQLYRSLWLSDARGLVRFQSQQIPYSVLSRGAESELLPAAEAAGVGVLAFQTLAGGLLSGRYQDGVAPDASSRMGSRAVYRERFFNTPMREGASVVVEEAARRDISATTLSIAWVLAQPAITAVLVGTSRVAQLQDAVDATEHPLASDEATGLARRVRERVEATH